MTSKLTTPLHSYQMASCTRIVLCGASSVGKTTLAKDWTQNHKEFVHISEVARDVMKQHSLTREDLKDSLKTPQKTTFLKLQELILEEQNRRELQLEKNNQSFISDRGPDPLAYVHLKQSPEAAEKLAQTTAGSACLQRYRSSLVLVLCPLTSPTDDGFRMVQNRQEQEEFTAVLCELLQKHNIPYMYVDEKDRAKRLCVLEREDVQSDRVYVRSIDIDQQTSSTSLKCYEQTNRMVDRYGSDNFIVLNFSRKLEAADVRKILKGGIFINGVEYQFIGCSSGGLKGRTCYMFKGSLQDVSRIWKECGAFSSINSRYKRLKRIGLLFSSAIPTRIEVPIASVTEVPDIEACGHVFTDGCGAISTKLADKVTQQCKVSDQYSPSVFQIRYQGCKGVVTVNNSLKGKQLGIRPSMKKFNPGTKPFTELWLCDHSRPYTFGHLNRQFITLLSSLGVPDEFFLQVQDEHFERLTNVLNSLKAAFEMLLLDNQQDLAMQCTSGDFLVKYSAVLTRVKAKMVSKLEKLRLPMLKSRNVFGVCDTTGELKYGQCFFRFTEQGQGKTLHGRVVVAKNPCYLLGDVRVLTAVDVKGLEHLVDCIVFPTEGKRPHPSEIAGSDLDGDQYFVSWDEGIIFRQVQEPYEYPSVDAQEVSGEVTHETLIDLFASQRNSMGKIDAYYKYWANRKGADCSECQALGKLFSRSVDATKTGDTVSIPSNLKPPLEADGIPNSSSDTTGQCSYVWEKMEEKAIKKKEELSLEIVSTAESNVQVMDEEFLWSLLEHRVPNLSEYQLLQLIHRWCSQQTTTDDEFRQTFLQFSRYINFGELTVDQQVDAIDSGIPLKTVTNALNQSTLPQSLVKKFSLDDPHRRWRFYFKSTSSEFKWRHLLRGVRGHPESMLIVKLPDKVTFVIHFLSPPSLGETELGNDSVVAYFSSSHFSLDLQCVLGSEFKLTLDDEKLQLYRGEKRATFIWLSNEREPKQTQRQGQKQDTLYDRISVDLTRFKGNVLRTDRHPTVNKQSFVSVEMFVKTENFLPAYMDVTEADIQDDFPVEEVSNTDEIDDLPDLEEDQETIRESPAPDTPTDALEVLAVAANRGNLYIFKKAMEVFLTKSKQDDLGQMLPHLHVLITMIVKKHCHTDLSVTEKQCLQAIITSLLPYCSNVTAIDLLQLVSHTAQLDLYSLMEMIIDNLLPTVQALQLSEYFSIISKWKLWYFIPPQAAVRLFQHLYSLYSSLCDGHHADPSEATGISLSHTDLIELTTNIEDKASLQQHQLDGYCIHFARLVFKHLICEIHSSHGLQREASDTATCLVMMRCYDYKNPHDAPSDQELEESERKEPWRVGFSRPTKSISSRNFTVGSFVAINVMKKRGSSSNVTSKPVSIGHIVRSTCHPADIVVEIVEPVPLCLKKSAQCGQGHWVLTLVGNVTLFNRSVKALKDLRENSACTGVLPLLVRSQNHSFKKADTSTSTPDARLSTSSLTEEKTSKAQLTQPVGSLNPNQEEAVCAALSQRLTLIHGPPGTGKTHVACEIVQQQLARDSDNPVLVVAETNLAVDNLCEKLLSRDIRVVRVGKVEQISAPIRYISLEGQIEKKRIQEGKDKQKSPFPNKAIVKTILKAAQVVATTCTSSGDPNLKRMRFPFVIVDEATQVTEPTSLIPLVYGCQQLTLIGDPEQLAPILPAEHGSVFDLQDLSVTLFHRLQNVLPSSFLNEQHRMHPKLMEFPSAKFYHGKLQTAKCRLEQQSTFQEDVPLFDKDSPQVFVRVNEHERRIGTSFCNLAEAKAVVKVIKCLINCNISPQQIAVLTPYLGQLKCIQTECQTEKINHIKLHTIDSFQGRECDVIIFSTVRCNSDNGLGFINDKYRMNVLLTRAKHGLIGVGSCETLAQGSLLWEEWFRTIKVIDESDLDFSKGKQHKGDGRRQSSGISQHKSDGRGHSSGTSQGKQRKADGLGHSSGTSQGKQYKADGGGHSRTDDHHVRSTSYRGFHRARDRTRAGSDTQNEFNGSGQSRRGRGRSSAKGASYDADVVEERKSEGVSRGHHGNLRGRAQGASQHSKYRSRGHGKEVQN